jgi:hypothetical protein
MPDLNPGRPDQGRWRSAYFPFAFRFVVGFAVAESLAARWCSAA